MRLFIICITFLFHFSAHSNEIIAIIGDNDAVTSDELDSYVKLKLISHNKYDKKNYRQVYSMVRDKFLQELVNNHLILHHVRNQTKLVKYVDTLIPGSITRFVDSMKVRNLDKYLEKHDITRKNFDLFMRADTVKALLMQDAIIKNTKSIDSEVELLLLNNNMKNTKKNREEAMQKVYMMKQVQAESALISTLRSLYYFEILK